MAVDNNTGEQKQKRADKQAALNRKQRWERARASHSAGTDSLLDLEHHRVHVLDVVEIAEHERGVGVEATGDDILRVLVRQPMALPRKHTHANTQKHT